MTVFGTISSTGDVPVTQREVGTLINLAGLLAARPAAATTNEGSFYLATDDKGGTLYRSDGSSWFRIAPNYSEAIRVYLQTATNATTAFTIPSQGGGDTVTFNALEADKSTPASGAGELLDWEPANNGVRVLKDGVLDVSVWLQFRDTPAPHVIMFQTEIAINGTAIGPAGTLRPGRNSNGLVNTTGNPNGLSPQSHVTATIVARAGDLIQAQTFQRSTNGAAINVAGHPSSSSVGGMTVTWIAPPAD